jgi:hypothetical protein
VRTALVVGYGVNFIDDDSLDGFEDFAAFCRGEEDVQRFRRGNEDVRGADKHGAAFVSKRIAGTHCGANFGHEQAALSCELQDFSEWRLQVFLNVVAEGLERRDVEDLSAVGQISRKCLANKRVNADEECGKSFSRTGGGGDQRSLAGEDVRPALRLRLGWRAEAADEPFLNERVSPLKTSCCRLWRCRGHFQYRII